jgi:hypothetical protein
LRQASAPVCAFHAETMAMPPTLIRRSQSEHPQTMTAMQTQRMLCLVR